MIFFGSFLLAAAYNLGIALYAAHHAERPDSRWRRSRGLRLGLLGGSFLLMSVWLGASSESPLAAIFLHVFLGFTLVPYPVLLCGHSFDRLQAWMRSDHQMVVEKTYDQAEAAERMRDWDRAAALYAEELDRDPDDLEARRRLAEVRARQGDGAAAARHLREILPRVADREKRANLGFRLAELLEREADLPGARRVLESAVVDLRGSRLEECARARLARLDRPRPGRVGRALPTPVEGR